MPIRRAGDAIAFLGILIMAAAYAWYEQFYQGVAMVLGLKGPVPVECLYHMSGPCRVPAMAAAMVGARAYEPLLFWAGALVGLVGLLMMIVSRASQPPSYSTRRTPQRIEPTL
jgi:hypothetical protein